MGGGGGVIGEHGSGSVVLADEFSEERERKREKNRERERGRLFESEAQLASSWASKSGPVPCISSVDTCNFNPLSKQV